MKGKFRFEGGCVEESAPQPESAVAPAVNRCSKVATSSRGFAPENRKPLDGTSDSRQLRLRMDWPDDTPYRRARV